MYDSFLVTKTVAFVGTLAVVSCGYNTVKETIQNNYDSLFSESESEADSDSIYSNVFSDLGIRYDKSELDSLVNQGQELQDNLEKNIDITSLNLETTIEKLMDVNYSSSSTSTVKILTKKSKSTEDSDKLPQALVDYYSALLKTTPLNERALCWDDIDTTFYYGFKVEAALEVEDLVNNQNYTVDDACVQAMADISDKIYYDITDFTNNYTVEHYGEEVNEEAFDTAYVMHVAEINNKYRNDTEF